MMQRPDRKAVLTQLQVPVLFILGKDDTAVTLESVLPQLALPGKSSVHIFEHTGHMGMWEMAKETSLALQQFVEFCNQ
jgi:pimeloyl-ACP methyl ester carboxylesterase